MNTQKILISLAKFIAIATIGGALLTSSTFAASVSLDNEFNDWRSFSKDISSPTNPPFPEEEVLQYISKRESIPIEQLEIINVEQIRFELLGRDFWASKALDKVSDKIYGVLVDQADGSFVDDIETVRKEERSARWNMYGKFDKDLYEKLQALEDNDQVTVMVSAVVKFPSDDELFAELTALYPEAQEAWESVGNPFEVGDSELIQEIETKYVQLIDENIKGQIQPLIDYLKTQDYDVTIYPGMPAIAVTIPKYQIIDLAKREDVASIHLFDKQETPLLDTAVPSNRAPSVWKRGIDGTGVSIGILEGGKVDFTGPIGHNWLHQGQIRSCSQPESDHKTKVASAAASYHDIYRGMAPQATVNDACEDGTETDIVNGLTWAAVNSPVINYSITTYYGSELQPLDMAFDYWGRYYNDNIIVAAGNSGGEMGTPAKGFNVITVGASNDNQTVIWQDDNWWSGSSWINPTDGREKPEVVAPGQDITLIGRDNVLFTDSGTSLAAPQVAGEAALLIDRNSNLDSAPNALKAIIIASAVHNIEGASRLSDKDGAGAIDAALADTAASLRGVEGTTPCSGPCWWNTYITPANFPAYTHLYRYFKVNRGEHVRVAIAWWSHAYCPNLQDCDFDFLSTDLDLRIYDPNGNFVVSSTSFVNNFEIVEFTAEEQGQYKIGIYRYQITPPPTGESSNYLGIAWIKDAAYLPDIRSSYNGWDTVIYFRNDGVTNKDLNVYVLDINGNKEENFNNPTFESGSMLSYNPASTNFYGSAVVNGSEDISVVVTHQRSSPESQAAYSGVSQPSTEVHIPLVHKNNYSWNSEIFIQNVGTSITDVNVAYKAIIGTSCTRTYYDIPVMGLKKINLRTDETCFDSPFVGSVWITSIDGQPLAVTSTQFHLDASLKEDSFMESEYAGNTANITFAPLMHRDNYGYDSSLALQNASSSTNSLFVTHFNDSGSECDAPADPYNNVYPHYSVIDAEPPGSCPTIGAAYFSGVGLPVAATINQLQSGSLNAGAYPAISTPAKAVSIPLWYNQWYSWSSSLVVWNTSSSQTATFSVTFYNENGSIHSTPISNQFLGTLDIYVVSGYPASNFRGSAVVTASQPVAVVVNHTKSGSGADFLMSHTGVHR